MQALSSSLGCTITRLIDYFVNFMFENIFKMNKNERNKKSQVLGQKKSRRNLRRLGKLCNSLKKSDSLSEKFVRSATCWCSKSSKKIPSESPKNENLSGRVTFVDSEVKVNSWRYLELERKSVFAFV